MAKLEYKLHITGVITVETGLHIGGSEVDLDIGGIDSEVIKVKIGTNVKKPYIPGSSLKGKLRSLIARQLGNKELKDDIGKPIGDLFAGDDIVKFKSYKGYEYPAKKKRDKKDSVIKTAMPSRLIVRDSYLNGDYYLEDKAENVIDRVTNIANPRNLERVTKGATFGLDMILDIYQGDNVTNLLQTLDLGFQILKKDYLGGSGTRGYGKVDISNINMIKMVFKPDGSIDTSQTVNYKFKSNPTEQ